MKLIPYSLPAVKNCHEKRPQCPQTQQQSDSSLVQCDSPGDLWLLLSDSSLTVGLLPPRDPAYVCTLSCPGATCEVPTPLLTFWDIMALVPWDLAYLWTVACGDSPVGLGHIVPKFKRNGSTGIPQIGFGQGYLDKGLTLMCLCISLLSNTC